MKAEVVSWFRIQELFRFQSFHLYGIIGSAIVVAAVSVRLIDYFGLRSRAGAPVTLAPKTMGRGVRYAVGSVLLGFSWALMGAWPEPMFALVGGGVDVMTVVLLSAVA